MSAHLRNLRTGGAGGFLAAALLLTACSGGGADDAGDPLAVLDTPPGAIDAASLDRLTPVARWGDGRADGVVVDPAGDGLVALTSVGIAAYSSPSDGSEPTMLDGVADRAALSSDGTTLVSTSIDGGATTVVVRRLTDPQPLTTIGPLPNATRSVVRLADDAGVAVGTTDALLVVDPATGAARQLATAAGGVRYGALAAASGAPLVAAVTTAGAGVGVELRDLDGTLVGTLVPGETGSEALELAGPSISADGAWLSATVRDRAFVEPDRVFVWSVADARVVARLETLGGDIATATAIPARTAPFVGGGALVVDASGAVVRVDALSGEVTPLVAGGDEIASAVTAIAGGTDGSTFAVGRVDGTTAVHDAVTGEVIAHSDGDATAIVSVQADGDGFVTLAASGRIELLAGGTSAVIERHATAEPTSLAMAVDGSLVAVSFADGSVEVRDLDGEVRQRIRTGTGRIDAAAFSPDRSRIATATGQKVGSIAYDDSLRLWNTTADSPTVVTTGPDDIAATIGGEQEDVAGCTFFRNGVAFTPDGRFVVTASHDYTVQLYDIEGGDVEHVFTGPRDSVLGLAVSPGGRFLAAAAEDALVRVWRLDDRELVHELGGGVAGFWSVAFSPTGRVLAASDATGVVRLWDVDSGHAVGELDGVKNTASNLAFSPDGRLLAAGAEASTIGVWDVRSGERLATLDGHLGVVQSVLFSPDGSTLLSAGLDDVARAWRVAP